MLHAKSGGAQSGTNSIIDDDDLRARVREQQANKRERNIAAPLDSIKHLQS